MPSDLDTIRSQSSISASALGDLIFDPGYREARFRIAHILSQEPLLDKSRRPHLNHAQQLRLSLRIFKRLLQLRDAHAWTDREFLLACRLQDDLLPTTFHDAAFVPVIASQGTAEQQADWLPRCRRYEVVGCYAQTELAHGSNVQELETVARFDVTSGEFVVSSPRLESTKWWVGGLGVMANHALVQAVLYLPLPDDPLEYKSYGPHLFIVPIRSLTTHEPLVGITVGGIGPKAYNGSGFVDHGYVHFKEVRIPLENMLMRHAQVTPTGEYKQAKHAKHAKMSYGSMVALRSVIPTNLGWTLARAVTVAIRYCIHRRQFAAANGGPERRVITYAGVKHRLFPLLAMSFAYIIAGRELWTMYSRMLEDVAQRGNLEMLAEMHSLSIAIKVKSSIDCVGGIEEARGTMGGHGYSYMSGIGPLFADAVPTQTYEGENYVISQQTSRSLLKHLTSLRAHGADAHPLPPSSSYLLSALLTPSQFFTQRSQVHTSGDWLLPANQLSALRHRAAFLVLDLKAEIPTSQPTDWASHSWMCARVTGAHADVYVVSAFQRLVSSESSSSLPAASMRALDLLCTIHALSTLIRALPELFESGYVTATQSRLLRKALDEAVTRRLDVADALKLTDAFAFTRFEMAGSLLGGDEAGVDIYGRMWEAVREPGGEGDLRDECLQIVKHYKRGRAKL